MIKVIDQYDLQYNAVEETLNELNKALADGYEIVATLPGWGFSEDYHNPGALILYKPDNAEPAEDPLDNREFAELQIEDELEPEPEQPAPRNAESAPDYQQQREQALNEFFSELAEVEQPTYPDTLEGFKGLVRSGDFVVLDTESTGLNDGEICQIAIIDSAGEVLLDTLVYTNKPIPAEATRIHHITNDDVKNKPGWQEIQPRVRDILRGKNVIIYNATYDRRMMHSSDEKSGMAHVDYKAEANYYCAMEHYAQYWGGYNSYHRSYTWQRLTNAAMQQGVTVENAHNALGDCYMTLGVIRKMAGIEEEGESVT